ncbi:Riboflavin biosynthesis protein RibF [compost metagenome]
MTLGTFDGVHKGHKSILDKLIKSSKSTGCESVVLTFFPHPRMVLQQNTDLKLLNTIDEKAVLLENEGIDNLIIHPFDHAFSRLTAEEFVKDILVDKLNIYKIIIGHDHRFGRNRTATIDDLIRFGQEYGFEVEKISALEINEVSVSSTKIRNALIEGNIETANDFLGYPYFINGTIVQGKQLGRTINFPTANIEVNESYKLIPANGVYVVSSVIDGKTVQGMMNIGTRPTVNGVGTTIEVHYHDFNGDLYDTKLKVSIYHRLRDEVKFESFDALKQQLEKDKQQSLDYFKNNPV